MKSVDVEQAVGMVLCQDVTRIVPGEFKGRAFKKGHIISKEDVTELLKMGKEHIYVWQSNPDDVHEDDAAMRIAQVTVGENMICEEPREGKSTLKSTVKGLFKVNSSLLQEINSIEDISIASLPGNFKVEQGQGVAGARVIPLMTPDSHVSSVEKICKEQGSPFMVKPYKHLRFGMITTGSEVYKGRIQDKFGPVIREKMAYYDAEDLGQIICPDDLEMIKSTIWGFMEKKADLIILTGGMSVDPDDLTPGAIRGTGASIVTYGAPVQPGNMFMMAYLQGTALVGVPGCGMYFRTTILDVVLPRIFAGELLDKSYFAAMGEGGLCSHCEVCRYPNCYFCR
ncbi:MAG TPA: molybdopterin-binding protein [Peptococcaceae bacterium]|nr:molybdopterin-binding protein [Peptococcaceae bacterium]